MKILFIHNYYRFSGGEDSVVAAEINLLFTHGHQVELWSMDNKDFPSGLRGSIRIKIITALNTTYSERSKKNVITKLKAFKPDLVHVHNSFPQISPSIYDACLELNIPVVQTLHNYRLICPGAMLMRNGKICELCVTGSPYQAALYNCYRDSTLGSLVVAKMVATHRKLGTWQHKINHYIALTDFAKAKFIEAGFPAEKISVKPNFVKDPFRHKSPVERVNPPFGLFVGRISAEKGLHTLLKAWALLEAPITLKVAGTGPLEQTIINQPNIEPLGLQTPSQISTLMQQAAFLILPSEWYEGFPLVLVEALAHGLPVLASNLGSMVDIIEDGKTGLLFEPGNVEDLATKLKWLLDNPDECNRFGANARQVYLDKYTAKENFKQLIGVYKEALLGEYK